MTAPKVPSAEGGFSEEKRRCPTRHRSGWGQASDAFFSAVNECPDLGTRGGSSVA